MNTDKGIIGALFDLSFSEFITTRIIKVIYILAILFAGLGAVFGFLGVLLSKDTKSEVLLAWIILAPLYFIVFVVWCRISLELIVVIFRIAENTSRLVEQGWASAKTSLSTQNP